jgi:antitoxin (DNA-binding transcriptional repressor) of toxin-antitoxin stability system
MDVLSALATQGETTTVSLLVTNFNMIGRRWTLNCSAEDVAITVTGIPSARIAGARAVVTLIDSTHAYAKAVWREWGSPTYPNASEVAAELAASQLVATPLDAAPVPGDSGALRLGLLSLEPYATALVQLTY